VKTIAGIPVFEVEFDKDGKLFDSKQLAALAQHVAKTDVTDLILFAHGWNNDMADARRLSSHVFQNVGGLLQSGAPAALGTRRFAGVVLLWPSKKFTDKDLIPGGGAAALGGQELAAIRARLKDFAREPVRLGKTAPASAATVKKVDRAAALLPKLATDPKAQVQFVGIIRSLLSDKAAHPEDGSKDFFKLKESQLLEKLRQPVPVQPSRPGGGGAAVIGSSTAGSAPGGAAGLSDVGDSILAGIRRLLNYATYYKMKERAGLVGANGVAKMLRTLRQKSPALRLHLVGHSFGARLVTAAADAAGSTDKIDTLTLLQGAYSHNGLAPKFDGKNNGFFRAVVTGKKVRGPILATCTKNDRAVGIAYPLASRVAGQNAAALGDENDPYGGIGRNGAVKTPEAQAATLLAVNSGYTFDAGRIYNLKADSFIMDHGDIAKPEVAWALLCAVATT
jgi:hypothetical protein